MSNKIQIKKHSIIITWILSLVIIVALPIILSTIIYFQAEKTLENQINRSNVYMLEQLRNNMDEIFGQMERLSIDIAYNTRISEFMSISGSLENTHIYDINKIIKDLKVYSLNYKHIDNFYIFFSNTDVILTPSFMSDSKSFYDLFHKNDNMSYLQWKDIIVNRPSMHYMTMIRRGDNNTNIKTTSFSMHIPVQSTKRIATLVVMIDESSLLDEIKNVEHHEESGIFIMDKNNNVLLKNNTRIDIPKVLIKKIENEAFDIQNGQAYNHRLDKQKYTALYILSQTKRLKYLLIMPTKVLWEKLHYVRSLMVISIIICLLIGSIAIYYFIKKNYNPIDKIMEMLRKNSGGHDNKYSNEFDFIESAISYTLDNSQDMAKKMKQQSFLIRDSVLLRLLKGRLDTKVPIENSLASVEIQLVSNYFAVMVMQIEDFNELFKEDVNLGFNERIDLIKFIMTNIIEELINENNLGFMTEIDSMMVCLVNIKSDNLVNWKRELSKVIEQAHKAIVDNFNVNYTVSISNIHDNIEAISQALQEALYVTEYKQIMGLEDTLYYDDIQEVNETIYYYPMLIEQQLVNQIKIGDYEKTKKLLEQIFNKNFENKNLSPKIAKYLMFAVANTIIKAINEINIDYLSNDKSVNIIEQLVDCKNINEMHLIIENIVRGICDSIAEVKENSNNEIVDSAKSFIYENYQNINLSIGLVGEQLKLTPYYVSKLFKEQEGESMQDFINKYRIEKAKDLMNISDYTIEQIAQKVGYASTRTFIRAFNKLEGIAPGKYKHNADS